MPRIGPLRTTSIPPVLGLLSCAMALRALPPNMAWPARPTPLVTPAFRQSLRKTPLRCACALRCPVLMSPSTMYAPSGAALALVLDGRHTPTPRSIEYDQTRGARIGILYTLFKRVTQADHDL